MSQRIVGRYEVAGSLIAVTALTVSEGKGGIVADVTCQRDGLGRLVVPGTALAGCLRRIVTDPRWGSQPGDAQAAVSRITTHDAPATGAERLAVRHGVAIDRVNGAAADRMLYSREVVSPGATFDLSFSVEAVATPSGDAQQATDELVARLVHALEAGIVVGGSTTRGLGEVCLAPGAKVTWTPLSSRQAFLDSLTAPLTPVTLPVAPGQASTTLTITIPWRPVSPLLISVPLIGGVDAVPQHVRTAHGVHLLLPGSSIKGVLRSHAERIVRTLTRTDIPDAPLDQFRQDLPLVSELFGRAPDAKGRDAWRGAVTCADVLSSEPVAGWDDLMAALPSRDPQARADAAAGLEASAWLRVDDHVAISRWTGGADDGKLFAWVAPWPTDEDVQGWAPMRLSVDLRRLSEAEAAIMLLAHVLRDLCGGWLAFGHGTTRGYGEVTADPTEVLFAWPDAQSRTLACLFADEESSLAMGWGAQTDAWAAAPTKEVRA